VKGYPTTFLGLFDTPEDERPPITEIEIPIIQRDFAQGRPDDETTAMRHRFIDAIVRAATTDSDLGLDFVYGEVRGGLLRPLDGQQRLTTLFLLHWYVASRTGKLDPAAPWLRFSYATRPTARDFSAAIAKHPYPGGSQAPSLWITDQPWYVYPWRQDPTITSMLVVLDAIHERIDQPQTNFPDVWSRLADPTKLGIWFLFLPVSDMDYGEDLYIKMNSRGKPLTQFEVFKADLEGELRPVLSKDQHEHLKTSIDRTWADLLWEYERNGSGDFVIDDEFIRYLTFIIDVCEWRDGNPDRRWHDATKSRERLLEDRARLAFADPANPEATRNREFFFHAFDTWAGVSPADEFAKLFTAGGTGEGPLPLLVSTSPDLFGACLSRYGADFSFAETLMLFAVLLAREPDRQISFVDLNRRLRSLRNLAESAFLESKRMTEYVATVERLIGDGTLEGAQGFNAEWSADERLKWEFMDAHPDATDPLQLLEDRTVVRGRLFAFDLEVDTIDRRSKAFAAVANTPLRDLLGAALLTKGDYSRDVGWDAKRRQLGSSARDDSWRDLLTTGSRASTARTRGPLMALLDDCADRLASDLDATAVLNAICAEWLAEREVRRYFDWRYYLVRYPGARSSMGEGYFHNDGYDETRGGFSYRRLIMLSGGNYGAYFTDSILRAAWIEGDLGDDVEEPRWWHRDDPGLTLRKSRIEIRSDDDAYELVLPGDDDATTKAAAAALTTFALDDQGRVLVSQRPGDGRLIDTEDRIQLCLRLVGALVAAGL